MRILTGMFPCTQDFLLTELRSLSEGISKLSLDEYQFCLGQKVVEESRHGKMLTLGDNGITARDTLVLLKVGSTLNITNPKVATQGIMVIDYLCVRKESICRYDSVELFYYYKFH